MEATQIFINMRMDKLQYIHIMKYYLGIKTKWAKETHNKMNLKSIMVNKEARLKILHTAWFHLYKMLKKQQQQQQKPHTR